MTEIYDLKEGHFRAVSTIEGAWPPRMQMVSKLLVKGRCFTLEIGVLDRIRFSVWEEEGSGRPRLTITSGRLVVRAFCCVTMIEASWTEAEGLGLSVNEMLVGSTANPLLYTYVFAIPERFVGPGGFDFTTKSDAALRRRATKLVSWTQGKAGRRAGGEAHLLSSLRAEASQLRKLILLIQAGDMNFTRTLTSKIRLFLHRDGQVPLLLVCAAIKNASLIIYTVGNPQQNRSIIPDFSTRRPHISGKPTFLLRNPVDIEVWLGFTAMYIDRRPISNASLIADLGNTIGDHLDPNIVPSVDALMQSETGIEGAAKYNGMESYITEIAEAVLHLADKILTAD